MKRMLGYVRRRIWLSLSSPASRLLEQTFGDRPFSLLDVGCGNHAPSAIKALFPNCRYFGIDIVDPDGPDLACMDRFYKMDLTALGFEEIPDGAFDILNLSHVLEHLPNGDKVLAGLVPKVRPHGLVLVEYPRSKSVSFHSMKGTLNFHDDPTHVRLYTLDEVCGVLEANGCRTLKRATRRSWIAIGLMPVEIPLHISRGVFAARDFWDLFGFAEYVFARRTPASP